MGHQSGKNSQWFYSGDNAGPSPSLYSFERPLALLIVLGHLKEGLHFASADAVLTYLSGQVRPENGDIYGGA